MIRNSIIFASALAFSVASVGTFAFAQAAKPATAIQFVTDQPSGESLARLYMGAAVQNPAGEMVGDVNDLVFDRNGHISTVVLGVGGFLGMGEKNVGVPFGAVTSQSGKDGARMLIVALSKDALKAAPSFKAFEKSTLDTMSDKAVQMKDQAAKKINDMTTTTPVKK